MRAVLLSLRRLGHILVVLVSHAAAWLAAVRLAPRWPSLGRRFPLVALGGPERLRRLFEDLGGTFIKFGQMLALQPDILPVEYCDALLRLLDRIAPFPYEEAARIVREELGVGPEEAFERFDREPLATASVGQVHRAVLAGRPVAVKVQRPDVEIEFHHDVRLMSAVMAVVRASRVEPWQWLLDPMGEFVAWSSEELDYRFEARYARALRANAATNPAQYVPVVVDSHSTRRLLVTELLDGTSLLDYLRAREGRGDPALLAHLESRGFEPRRFATHVVANFLGDAFRHGVYHADLHPANLMILEDNVVGYVDFGITGLMSPYSRHHLVGMSLGLARGDLDALYRSYLAITVHGPGSDYATFRASLTDLAAEWYRDSAAGLVLTAKVTRIFNEIFDLSRRCRVMPERDIVKYIRSSIAIDGLLARFAPGHDISAQIAERCSEHLRGEARRAWASPTRALDAWSAATRLAADGPALLERLGGPPEGPMSRSSDRVPTDPARRAAAGARGRTGADWKRARPGSASALRPLAAAAVALVAAVLFAVAPLEPQLGVNLPTAQLAVVAAGCWSVLSALRRREA